MFASARRMLAVALSLAFAVALFSLARPADASSHSPFFRITVIDQETGRGIPCVKLQMTNGVRYWTDSAGVVAFCEPDLVGHKVWFTVESHGYINDNILMFPGVVIDIEPGGSAVIPLRRTQIAQRLLRLTGSGIYRDSILLGDDVPQVGEPGLVPVAGQDGSDVALYKGKLYWLWGDTGIARFPLGVYRGTCAVSELPENGGLDPYTEGVALKYFRRDDEHREAKPIINMPSEGGKPYWYVRPRVVFDENGEERLLTDFVQVDEAMRPLRHCLGVFNEDTEVFDLVVEFPEHPVFETEGGGTTVFRYVSGGREYFYNASFYPNVRYPTDYASQADIGTREAFTCLKPGSRHDDPNPEMDRDEAGKLRWSWRKDTAPISEQQMARFIREGLMTPEEQWYAVEDVQTGTQVLSHHGSIYWNPYRQRWISIRLQSWGDTLVGELWYLEADTPMGPWVYARKILTHDLKGHTASYYTPAQIPYFDRDGGRVIFIKGSYSAEFGDVDGAPPRHNYNIMAYKLELDDPRLFLPVPVYHDAEANRFGTKEAFPGRKGGLDLAWYAPDRPAEGTVPVFQAADGSLSLDGAAGSTPVFHAVAADAETEPDTSLHRTIPLYEYTHGESGAKRYSTGESLEAEGFARNAEPVFRVWPKPIHFNPLGEPDGLL